MLNEYYTVYKFILPMGVRTADTITTSLFIFTPYVASSHTTPVTSRRLSFDSRRECHSLAGRDRSIPVRVFPELWCDFLIP